MIKSVLMLKANELELAKFRKLKSYYRRRSDSDTIRYLIEDSYDKIFLPKI